jgi:hypothetical protein
MTGRIIIIVIAIIFGVFGLRLFLNGMRALILFLKVESVPVKSKERIFRDMAVGVLFVVLAFALLT